MNAPTRAPLCVLVGAGPGLGAAIGRRFAAGGFAVALLSRHAEQQTDPAPASPGATRSFRADAGDEGSMRTAFGDVRRWGGDVDVLVHHAAAMAPDDVDELSTEDLLATMRVNAGGLLNALPHVLPGMRARGAGTILVTGGGLGLEPYPGWAGLGAGKAALRNLTLGLHKRLAPEGIRVAVVAVCGVVEPGTDFDPDTIAELYWQLHREPADRGRRELVHLPPGADPFYNDPGGEFRSTSQPLVPTGPR